MAEVARVLRDLALTDGPLLLQLLELGNDHTEHLHDDAGGDVRHDAERKDREATECTAGEQVEEAQRALRLDTLLELLDGIGIDARNTDGGAEPIQRDHHENKQDLVPQIGDLEDILQVRQHSDSLVGSAGSCEISGW